MILATALAVTVGPGLAQPAQGPFRAPASRSETPAPGSLREAPAPPAPGSLYIVEKPGNTLLATEYLGRAVQGPDKQKVGTINDLLVDTTGRVIGVVIDVGGFLGIGGKEIAIAFEALPVPGARLPFSRCFSLLDAVCLRPDSCLRRL